MLDFFTLPDWILIRVDQSILEASLKPGDGLHDELRRRLLLAPLFYCGFYSVLERLALMNQYRTIDSAAARRLLLDDFKKSTDIALGYDRVITAGGPFFATSLTVVTQTVTSPFPDVLSDAQYWAVLVIGFSGNEEQAHHAITERTAPYTQPLITRLREAKAFDALPDAEKSPAARKAMAATLFDGFQRTVYAAVSERTHSYHQAVLADLGGIHLHALEKELNQSN
jgi:hypothetical protein